MRKWLISIGLVVCLLMAFALPMCAPAPPVEEEEAPPVEEELASSIKAYMCGPKVTIDPQRALIRGKLGVELRILHISCGEAHARLVAEAPKFSADIVIQCCGPQAVTCRKEGWSIPYDSPAWRDASEAFKDPDNHWFNLGSGTFVLLGNKNLLAEKGLTIDDFKSWDDLLDPKWKGQIVMPSPVTSGTAFRMLFTFMTCYGFNADKGEEGGWEYLEALNKNMHHYTRSGNAPTDLVARGEFILGITSAAQVLDRIEKGFPVEWTVPEEGTGYDPTVAFILKGCAEEYTCQKIIDVLGSLELGKIMAANGYVTRFPEAPAELYGGLPKLVPNIDLEWAYENKDRLCAEWKDKFLKE